MPSRSSSSALHRREVEPEVVGRDEAVPARGRPAPPCPRRGSARSRAARSGRRSCAGRSGRPCGRSASGVPPRSRTARRSRRTSRRPAGRARRRGCRSWTRRPAVKPASIICVEQAACRAARCRGRRARAGTTPGVGSASQRDRGQVVGAAAWAPCSAGSPAAGRRRRRSVVRRQRRQGVVAGAEAVHEQQRQPHVVPLAQREHLAGDDVEEGQPVADLEQRLGPVQAHRGAQAAVELDTTVPAERLDARRRRARRRRRAPPCRAGSMRASRDHAGLAALDQPVVVAEHLDGHRVDALGGHLVPCLLQALVAHGPIVGAATPGTRGADGRLRRAISGQKIALRDQLRHGAPAAGRCWRCGATPEPIAEHLLASRADAPGRHRRGVRLRSAREPGTGPLLERSARAGRARDPAGGAARRRPRLGACTTARWSAAGRGLLEPDRSAARARGGRDRRRGADARPGGRPPTGCGWGGEAAATTGRWAGCRWARSPCTLLLRRRAARPRCRPTPHDRPVAAAVTPPGGIEPRRGPGLRRHRAVLARSAVLAPPRAVRTAHGGVSPRGPRGRSGRCSAREGVPAGAGQVDPGRVVEVAQRHHHPHRRRPSRPRSPPPRSSRWRSTTASLPPTAPTRRG